jgi:hypothetical protein
LKSARLDRLMRSTRNSASGPANLQALRWIQGLSPSAWDREQKTRHRAGSGGDAGAGSGGRRCRLPGQQLAGFDEVGVRHVPATLDGAAQ